MYRDGEGYQNRNRILSSALSDITKARNITIEQLILEKGHTMMEADSVHSTLEQKFVHNEIYAPSDYLVLMRSARPRLPYHVHSVDNTFFRNFESLPSNFSSIRPGKKPGDPKVTDVRDFLYKPSGDVLYKLNHNEGWTVLPCRRTAGIFTPAPLYAAPIKIGADKFKCLQDLKCVTPSEYHIFYDSLLHE